VIGKENGLSAPTDELLILIGLGLIAGLPTLFTKPPANISEENNNGKNERKRN
jgi:hypothetical protein